MVCSISASGQQNSEKSKSTRCSDRGLHRRSYCGRKSEIVLEKFEVLLLILKEEGFTINLNKSYFFVPKVEFLGFEVSSAGIRPGEAKILAVKRFPLPKSVREVQQFLGLAGFFRRFVRNFSVIAAPLYSLLKKDATFVWAEQQMSAFTEIQRLLISRPLLALYDPDNELFGEQSLSNRVGS
ncbi:uncharacterized protein LOC129741765 [Uranotaenia lowii]|uniref:uncharacterized protein LOC129741765 n=1 Tax=Uranotaenia lowii TaxID=190385 RepID=UPI00247A46EC|nr:uncharacterized protein LOC129741765 [Uranotaenia lowii]